MDEPVQNPNGSHQSDGGPVHKRDDSHHGHGGHAHSTDDSHPGYGGPVQGSDDSQWSDGEPVVWPGTADLRALAQSLDDAIRMRTAVGNRVGHEKDVLDADLALVMLAAAQDAENAMRKMLLDAYHIYVPEHVREWALTVPGLASGELFPRICGVTGNPRVAVPWKWPEGAKQPVPDGPPRLRSLRQLWQWAGAGDPYLLPYSDVLGRPVTREDKLAAGKRTQLRPLLYVWSSSLLRSATPVTKPDSPRYGRPVSTVAAESKYWRIFCEAREAGKDRKHERQCKNRKRAPWSNGCGTVAHPEWGAPGSPWRPNHILRHAHRMAQKELLRDFWRVADGRTPRP